jgi:hypothetical protein
MRPIDDIHYSIRMVIFEGNSEGGTLKEKPNTTWDRWERVLPVVQMYVKVATKPNLTQVFGV